MKAAESALMWSTCGRGPYRFKSQGHDATGNLHKWRCARASFASWPFPFVFIALLALHPPVFGEATCSLYCVSLRFAPSEGPRYTLEFVSSESTGHEPNGELFLLGTSAQTSNGAYVREYGSDATTGEAFGEMLLNVPFDLDGDHNGLPDFFEVAREIPQTHTSGTIFHSALSPASVSAVWQRSAGSTTGNCQLSYADRTFALRFEVLNYTGLFSYARSRESISGPVTLSKIGDSGSRWEGSLSFTRVNEDRIVDSPSSFTNELGGVLSSIASGNYDRHGRDFDGVFVLMDGMLSTAAADYRFWMARLSDTADQDGDGIADLSDADYSSVSGGLPSLSIAKISNAVKLSWPLWAAGYNLESADQLFSGNWSAVSNPSTQEGELMTVTLRISGVQKFYRLRKN